ncbi:MULTISPECIES: hypothetical protein [unclassified Moorena]|uniref:hypothetical protein n=1 Tax=unclassified Moorena TaxID=2683338 RepID=UPI0014019A0D|nr:MULTISPECIES: hypothetical protein [unclassified Moorena]NEO17143.1 hypothetical protein [Moorena sp. SIO3E8]NEO50086.1 hypothetical protein [Moorena sp. SIO4A3]NEQ03704.1 hypothetical protein [Moorena sp. SIO3F7]
MATLREQPVNLQGVNLGQKATLREQLSTLAKRPRYANNFQPWPLATLREQPVNLKPFNNLGQKATLREQPSTVLDCY